MKKIDIKYKMLSILFAALLIVGVFAFKNYINPRNLTADSGFDSSYDSGSSWSSSDSWSSSSWSSSDSSSSSGSSYSGSGKFTLFDFIILILILGYVFGFSFVTFIIGKSQRRRINTNYSHSYDISDELFNKYINISKEEFKKQRYNDYVSIQEGWMNFDYQLLRDKLTDELYNQYEMQLETLKTKNQKNIMKDFEYKKAYITSLKEQNSKLILTMELSVWQIDYIEEDGKCVRGRKNIKNKMCYVLTFIKDNSEKIENCPNCGAPITKNVSHNCEFCRSFITINNNDWVLSKKQVKRQG